MKRIAFLFTQVPHGTCAGREGLDAVLASSVFNQEIGIFFIGDGVLQLNIDQYPEKILARNYSSTFGILKLYDIDQCFVCETSLSIRGQILTKKQILTLTILNPYRLRKKITTYDHIMRF